MKSPRMVDAKFREEIMPALQKEYPLGDDWVLLNDRQEGFYCAVTQLCAALNCKVPYLLWVNDQGRIPNGAAFSKENNTLILSTKLSAQPALPFFAAAYELARNMHSRRDFFRRASWTAKGIIGGYIVGSWLSETPEGAPTKSSLPTLLAVAGGAKGFNMAERKEVFDADALAAYHVGSWNAVEALNQLDKIYQPDVIDRCVDALAQNKFFKPFFLDPPSVAVRRDRLQAALIKSSDRMR